MAAPLLIVQSSPTKQTAYDLAVAARARGFAIQDISFDRGEEQPPSLEGHDPIFVFGSVALIDRWSRQYPELAQWIWYDHDRLGPEVWARSLGERFLNAGGSLVQAGRFCRDETYEEGLWHVRPLRNDKRPPGRLYRQAEICDMDLPVETALWVSRPQAIEHEVRVWFVGGQAVTASQYRRNGQLVALKDTPETVQALAFAGDAASVFLPFPHCVMDVGRLAGGAWKVIEFNPIHGAGWYAADPGRVLDAFVGVFR
jgi:hypothetical protein